VQSCIGDVVARRKDRHADRIDPLERLPDQQLDQVDVVDHQIQDHVDVGAARRERREPVRLDEQRLLQDVLERDQRGIEALEVADLEDPLLPLGERDQPRRLVQRRGRSASQ
jgi:hypothetical protein